MERERIAELDLLRFTAAVSVVLFHAVHWPEQRNVLSDIFNFGFMGVPLFFTISGFVILMTAQGRSGIEFVNSRIARLYPTFWICVLLSCAALATLGDGAPPLEVVAANLTMQPRMVFGQPYIDAVYWTLAVEMKFYAWIFVLIVTRQLGRIELVLNLWLGAVIVASVIAVPHWLEALVFPMWASLFISGCYLYLMRSRGMTARRLIPFAVSVLVSMYWSLQYQDTYTQSTAASTQLVVMALVLAINVVFLFIAMRKWSLPRSRLWLWLGCLTYPLYLTHGKVGGLVWHSLEGSEWPRMWGVLGMVLLLSILLAAVIERRVCGAFNRWLNRVSGQLLALPTLRFARPLQSAAQPLAQHPAQRQISGN